MPVLHPSNVLDCVGIALDCIRPVPTVAIVVRGEGGYVRKKIRQDRLRS